MNESVELVGEPALMRNSLILIGLTFRTFSAVVSECFPPVVWFVHCLLGTEMLNWTPTAGAPVVFVNVTVVSCEEPGENVWSPGGVAVAGVPSGPGARLSRGTSYLAATTLACTNWSVASEGKVPAAVIAPS